MAVKCSSGVCQGTDPATVASIRQLQLATNRFSVDPDIGFSPLAIDGLVGPATAAAVFYALTSISLSQSQDLTDMGLSGQATLLIDQMNTPEDIANQADFVAQVIDTSAGVLGLPSAASIVPAASSSPRSLPAPRGAAAAAAQKAVLAKKSGITGGLFGLNLPPWAIYIGGGAIAYLALAFVWKRMRRSRRVHQ